MKTFTFFLLGLAIAAQAQQVFETHIYKNNFPKTKLEMCRELASVKAEATAESEKEKIEVFQRAYKRCMRTETGEI
ncbi:hypothetical protein [Persephonella sp.]|uniref:hypothetical protein n=1 Tax=Persephonella sp. TaxID=2060922 RepID=UPI0026372720|nr:hypothetical protein [Persephonella sp.]